MSTLVYDIISVCNPPYLRLDRKTRHLRQIRARRQIQHMYIIKRTLAIIPPEQEHATIRKNRRMIPARAGRFPQDGAGFVLEGDEVEEKEIRAVFAAVVSPHDEYVRSNLRGAVGKSAVGGRLLFYDAPYEGIFSID